jgi:hypothetical protein
MYVLSAYGPAENVARLQSFVFSQKQSALPLGIYLAPNSKFRSPTRQSVAMITDCYPLAF